MSFTIFRVGSEQPVISAIFWAVLGEIGVKEVIIVRAHCEVIRRDKELCAIGSAIEKIGELDRAKLAQEIGDVARGDLRVNLVFAVLKIQLRDFLDKLGTSQSGRRPWRKLQRLGADGEAPSSKSQAPEKTSSKFQRRQSGTKIEGGCLQLL